MPGALDGVMELYEIIDQVAALLQQRGRLAYQALKYQFKLDDEGAHALKAELIDAKRVAVDEDGKVLVWVGTDSAGEKGKREKGESAKWNECQ